MARDMQKNTMFIEQQDPEAYHQNGDIRKNFVDDDGREKRTGIYIYIYI